MKKMVVLVAILFAVAFAVTSAAADVLEVDGNWHIAPRVGYSDSRASGVDGDFAWGADVSYQWNYHHEVGFGVLASSPDVDAAAGASSNAKSIAWDLGYTHHFEPVNPGSNGNFFVGVAVAHHRIKYSGNKWSKAGAKLDVGYQWNSGWQIVADYLFAGTDDLGLAGTADDVEMGGFTLMVGYKF